MKARTEIRLVMGLFALFLVLCMIFMLFSICEDVKAESVEVLINEYPVWVDSTFQTVQIRKCWEIYPNGQRELRGYMVVVDSAGCRTYEEEPEYFLFQATIRAMRLQAELGKK